MIFVVESLTNRVPIPKCLCFLFLRARNSYICSSQEFLGSFL